MSKQELKEKSIEAREDMRAGRVKEANEIIQNLNEQDFEYFMAEVSRQGTVAGYSL